MTYWAFQISKRGSKGTSCCHFLNKLGKSQSRIFDYFNELFQFLTKQQENDFAIKNMYVCKYWYFTQLTVTLLHCSKVLEKFKSLSSGLCTIFCK